MGEQPQEIGQEVAQAEMFSADELGTEQRVIEIAKTPEAFTGREFSRDRERVLRAMEMLSMGWSQRKVAKRIGASRNTIRRLVEWMEAEGRLEPEKERIAKSWGQITVSTLELLQEKIDADKIPATCLPVLAGIGFDKRQVAHGEATSIHEVRSGPNHDDLSAKIRQLNSTPIEAEVLDH